MGQRGKLPKTATELKLAGAFREDRHADREILENEFDGVPIKPDYLDGEAGAYWDRIVPQLVASGRVKQIDTEMLVCACECWAQYRDAVKRGAGILERNNAFYAYKHAVTEVGLSPKARARMPVVVKPKADPDSVDSFARKRA